MRFFYAPPIFATWSKVFVLTEDGKLYTEYLKHLKITPHFEMVNYNSFQSNEFKWEKYQPIREITKEEALQVKLTLQENWVENYLKSLN